jgi:hypothetical protein
MSESVVGGLFVVGWLVLVAVTVWDVCFRKDSDFFGGGEK